jgi:hypothetical protein
MLNVQNDRNASEYIYHGKEYHEYGEDIDNADFHPTKIEDKAQSARLKAQMKAQGSRRKAQIKAQGSGHKAQMKAQGSGINSPRF